MRSGWKMLGGLLLLVVAWQSVQMLLVIFVGVLVALFLRGLADWLGGRLGWNSGWSLTVVVVLLIAITSLTGYLLAPEIGRQAGKLAEQLPHAADQLEGRLQSTPWGAQ